VFVGTPINKITISESDVIEAGNSGTDAKEYQVVIEEIEGEFYWASRENLKLVPVESGAYITFIATNGSGYIPCPAAWKQPLLEIGSFQFRHLRTESAWFQAWLH
jgi:hypothetical protein